MDLNEYKLLPSPKRYRYDQDKCLDPVVTYKRAFGSLKKAFPDKKIGLKTIDAGNFKIFDFGDSALTSHGKGATKDQSKASAIMEFSERMSWLNFDYKNAPGYRKVSFNDLNKNNRLRNIGKAFYIPYSNKKNELAKLIKDIPLDWIYGYSLTHGKRTYYPINWNNDYQTSNGLAAGNTKEEAIVQGICEVIERHNVDHFLYNIDKTPIELIDPKSITDRACKKLISLVIGNGFRLFLINASQDIGVSTIIACGMNPHSPHPAIRTMYGYGAHTDPQKAIIRAVTEYLQGYEGAVNKMSAALPKGFKYKGNWEFILDVDIDKYLSKAGYISCKDLPNHTSDDVRDEALTLVHLLDSKGLETIIINKTHPLIRIPTYRIFVPGALPGSIHCSANHNEELMMCVLYIQGGQKDKASKYYKKHFKKILEIMDPVLNTFKALSPHNEKIMHKLTPENMSMESVIPYDDYSKYNQAYIYKNR